MRPGVSGDDTRGRGAEAGPEMRRGDADTGHVTDTAEGKWSAIHNTVKLIQSPLCRRRHSSSSSSSDSDHSSSRRSSKKSKKSEVERLAEIERQRYVLTRLKLINNAIHILFLTYRRIKDVELKSIEEKANERIEELVAKRVEEELERRREEIEAEVLRRVAEAKKVMEAQMMEELEKRKAEQLAEAERREVRMSRIVEAIVAELHRTPTGRKCRVRAPAL